MELTAADKIMEKGREEGREEGRREAQREILLRHLNSRFGPLPEKTTARVQGLESLDELNAYLDHVLVANSREEMALGD